MIAATTFWFFCLEDSLRILSLPSASEFPEGAIDALVTDLLP
jgi:hypothetical protein